MHYPFEFGGMLDRFGVGRTRKVWYNVLFLPDRLLSELPFGTYPRLRVEGEIAEVPVEGAWIPAGDGRRYFIVAPRVIRYAALSLGDQVEMRFRTADQDAVDVPDELVRALAASPSASSLWQQLSAGKKRAFAQRVHGARTSPTRLRRTLEVISELEALQAKESSS